MNGGQQHPNGLTQRRLPQNSVNSSGHLETTVTGACASRDDEDSARPGKEHFSGNCTMDISHSGREFTARRRKASQKKLLCREKMIAAIPNRCRRLFRFALVEIAGFNKRSPRSRKNGGTIPLSWCLVFSAVASTAGFLIVLYAHLSADSDSPTNSANLRRSILSSISSRTHRSPTYDPLVRVSFPSLLSFPYRSQKKDSHGTFPSWINPPNLPGDSFRQMARKSSYGGLVLMMLENVADGRVMFHDFSEEEQVDVIGSRRNASDNDDNVDYYYDFDDDALRNPLRGYDDDTIASKHRCRRTAWHRNVPLNCNMFHELGVAYDSTRSKSVEDLEFTYLGYAFNGCRASDGTPFGAAYHLLLLCPLLLDA
jgi:hypothetical protein